MVDLKDFQSLKKEIYTYKKEWYDQIHDITKEGFKKMFKITILHNTPELFKYIKVNIIFW